MACLVAYLLGKIYEDLYIELNRDKTQAIISIFQVDFLKEFDLDERRMILVNCDQETLINQIESLKNSRRTKVQSTEGAAITLSNDHFI